MVSDNINGMRRTLEVVPPGSESLEDGEQLLVVDIVVEFRGGKRPGVECDQMNFVFETYGDDGSEGVVGGISLNDNRNVRDLLGQCWSRGEDLLEGVEGFLALFGPDPRSGRTSEAGEGDRNIRVERNEATIKISKSQE